MYVGELCRELFIYTMLSYQLEGNGFPLLLIHGLGVTGHVWQELVPLLSPHFQLILVELPAAYIAGAGVCDAPYYRTCSELLEELRIVMGLEHWAILAYSTGTRVSEAYVQQYPQHVTRAIFLCPLYLRKPWQIGLHIEEWVDARYPNLTNWFFSGWRLSTALLGLCFNLRRSAAVKEWMRELTHQSPDNLKHLLLALPGKGRAPFTLTTTSDVPVLFIWGRSDVLVACPPRWRAHANDRFIFANHGAPVLAAEKIARIALPFFSGEIGLPQSQGEAKQHVRPLFKPAFSRTVRTRLPDV